ncbi:hypothetical protein AMTRI_Chr02g222690 [Amborella trichopoda]|uniref:Uncharacterized protein n=1 Tax=Amborella trichopoda TaxID=13333 RepID=W1P3Q0_AMBTC|nr:dormancy-associated protein homolog 3 [Amborella trichopoda]ERN02259.1 hypothetical protein AMTR_s00045p00231900 [Amborella trichopoda]|eukprot:XP_006840584.1 dormancy-associated protein homolog 3 [Amborella trichopoda]
MAFLDKLWDDTLAGPQPENGLSKLRKPVSRPSPAKVDEFSNEANRVTRSIMIVKPPSDKNNASENGTPPSSPAGMTPPVSPFAGAGRFRRRFSLEEYERSRIVGGKSPRGRFSSDEYERGGFVPGGEKPSLS